MTDRESESDRGDVFEIGRVRDFVKLMIEHGLTEIDLRQHGQTIRLRRGGETENPSAHQASPAQVSSRNPVRPESDSVGGSEDADTVLIKSPMVGTFYATANPDAEPFVQVGQEITATTTVCIIEAMKVFNEIAAEVAGKIVAILVENEEPVEFGKPLFKVRKLT